jgi:hypothetical protein
MIDYDSETIKRLWTILENNTDFAAIVDPPNRIKLFAADSDEEDAGQDPIKTTWNDGDFPEVVIYSPSGSDSLWSTSAAYGMRGGVSAASKSHAVELKLDMAIEVTHQNLNAFRQRKMDDAIRTAIRGAGPNLGITAFNVFPVGPMQYRRLIAAGRAGDIANAGGMKRWVTIHTLGITIPVKSAQLLS